MKKHIKRTSMLKMAAGLSLWTLMAISMAGCGMKQRQLKPLFRADSQIKLKAHLPQHLRPSLWLVCQIPSPPVKA